MRDPAAGRGRRQVQPQCCVWQPCTGALCLVEQALLPSGPTVVVGAPACAAALPEGARITPHCSLQKGEFHRLADAKIFLSDCLACDSCVTAEEGVQLSQQNAADFLRVVNLNKVWCLGM